MHATPSPTRNEITLTAPTGDTIPISPKNVYAPRKNLGHYKAPGGNYLSQKEAILKKAGASQEPAGLKQPYSTSDNSFFINSLPFS